MHPMAKSRKNPTLIEVINKTQSTPKKQPDTNVPEWFGNEANPPSAPTVTTATPKPADTTTAPPSQPAKTRKSPPIFRIDGPRVVLTFSSVLAAIVLFAAGAALIAAYELGKTRGDEAGHQRGFQAGMAYVKKSTADEIESARKSLPNPDVLSRLGTSPVKNPKPSQTNAKSADNNAKSDKIWVRDHTYIVVQDFLTADLNDARHARDFLAENSIESVILDASGKYGYRLVATKGFNCSDPDQKRWCDKFHKRIASLGKEFRKAGGRYNLEGYKKKATGQNW